MIMRFPLVLRLPSILLNVHVQMGEESLSYHTIIDRMSLVNRDLDFLDMVRA